MLGLGRGWNIANKAPVLGKPVAIMGGGGGGGHGAAGAFACIGFSDGGPAYGDQSSFQFGSGGGSGIYRESGGRGGGRIVLDVKQVIVLNGRVSSTGANCLCADALEPNKLAKTGTQCGGAGSGGFVRLIAPEVYGIGNLFARGGDCILGSKPDDNGGGGGGGRISMFYERMSSAIQVSVDAGQGGCGKCVAPPLTNHFGTKLLGELMGWMWVKPPQYDVGRLEKNMLRIWPEHTSFSTSHADGERRRLRRIPTG